jgi:hypothetical protein
MFHHHKLSVRCVSVALIGCVALVGCGKSSVSAPEGRHITTFNPAERSFAEGIGITGGPITEDQAKQIAIAAAGGGTATLVEREDQDGTAVFGVQVQSPSGEKDVKVRISDGAVTQIEEGGPDTGGEGTGRED